MKRKAEEFSCLLDETEGWRCSNGWLGQWKTRHNVKYKAVSGENAFVDKDVCKEWKERTLLPILKSYKFEDIFNCDETGLYWRLFLTKHIL